MQIYVSELSHFAIGIANWPDAELSCFLPSFFPANIYRSEKFIEAYDMML